jgi:hypothetical protein
MIDEGIFTKLYESRRLWTISETRINFTDKKNKIFICRLNNKCCGCFKIMGQTIKKALKIVRSQKAL